MDPSVAPLLGPNCFWFWLHEHFPPNVLYCEERLCSLVVTPFNAWSNLAFLLVSFYTWIQLRHHSAKLFRFFSQAVFWVGLSSFVYHMSLNLFTQVFDFFGMYLFCFLLLMYNLDRVGKWPKGPAALRAFWGWVIGFTALTETVPLIYAKFPIQIFILILILAIIRTELQAPASPLSPQRKYFWGAVGSMALALTFSILDVTRKLCDTQNHFFQGHGLWHVLCALALLCAYQHYRQIWREA